MNVFAVATHPRVAAEAVTMSVSQRGTLRDLLRRVDEVRGLSPASPSWSTSWRSATAD
jgi:hypothetical protein